VANHEQWYPHLQLSCKLTATKLVANLIAMQKQTGSLHFSVQHLAVQTCTDRSVIFSAQCLAVQTQTLSLYFSVRHLAVQTCTDRSVTFSAHCLNWADTDCKPVFFRTALSCADIFFCTALSCAWICSAPSCADTDYRSALLCTVLNCAKADCESVLLCTALSCARLLLST
jgi:hypothetical protein